jgi:hypothetical protein
VLGLPGRAQRLSGGARTALLFGALALVAVAVALLDPRPSLRHVKVAIASGPASGQYHATVERIGAEVAREKGRVRNRASAGSVENVERLLAARDRCDLHFALIQDGIVSGTDSGIELLGRLPRAESLIVLGRDADRIRTVQELRGLTVGIGPDGSGTAAFARRVLAPLAAVGLRLVTLPIDEQLARLQRGELDLGAMVIDEDAALVVEAVRDRGLQILDLPDAAALARHHGFVGVGRIEPGQYDYARHLPPGPRRVLRVDTLLVGNGCGSLSQTQGLMTAVAQVFPTFVRHNRGEPNLTGLPQNPVARSFFDDEGPDALGRFAPWLVDVMPSASWLQLVVGFSMLFSAMSLWHRFRLWRIDAQRVSIERDVPVLFGAGTTVGDIATMAPLAEHRTAATRDALDALIGRLGALAARCRRLSLSVLVPMGEEMSYRYQETLIADLTHALRAFRERLDA